MCTREREKIEQDALVKLTRKHAEKQLWCYLYIIHKATNDIGTTEKRLCWGSTKLGLTKLEKSRTVVARSESNNLPIVSWLLEST